MTPFGPECYHHVTVAKNGELFKCYSAFEMLRQS